MNKKKFYPALIIFSLVGQIAWVVENMYFNVFIYKMFNASADDIALMVQASAVAATLTTIFIGALSDKIGKRKIFMCAGYIAWGVSILSFALVRLDVIKAVREITGLGLIDAKKLVDGAPATIKEAVAKDAADEMVEKLKAAGAEAELK